MKTNKIIALLAFIGLFHLSSIKAQDLRLVSDVWPPFTDEKGNKAIALNLVQTAFERMSIPMSVEIKDFEIIIESLKTGEFSGSAALWKTAVREEFITFSEPYLQNQLILVGLKGTDVKNKSLSDLGNAKVGIVQAYAYGERVIEGNDVEFIKSESDQKNLEKLISKEIDYMLVDNILIYYLIKYQVNDIEEILAIASEPIDTKNLYLGISKTIANSEEIVALFNEEIKKMMLDGSYHAILGVNWVESDINGDGVKELIYSGNTAGESQPVESNTYEIFKDGEKEENQKFFVNGKFYEDWNSVPDSIKKNPTVNPAHDLNPGLRLNF